MRYILLLVLCCHLLSHVITADRGRQRDRNINPQPPTIAAAQLVIAANGAIRLTTEFPPFPNIFVDGDNFLRRELKFSSRDISRNRQLAEAAWLRDFNISVSELVEVGDVEVSTYQVTSDLNTNAHLATNPCYTPAEGYETLEGGFRLIVTNPNGILITQNGFLRTATRNTSFFFSWFVLKNIRRSRNDCPGVVRAKHRAARSLIGQIVNGRGEQEKQRQKRGAWQSRSTQRNQEGGAAPWQGSRNGTARSSRGNNRCRNNRCRDSEEDEDDDVTEGLPPRDIILQYKTLQPGVLLNASGFAEVSIVDSNYNVFEIGRGLVVDGIPKHTSPGSSRLDLLRTIHILFE